ncbi:MAG: Crp/Fnr family transcriptional regulator [Synergistaceae bacterium]|jgi:CRP/FNR family transcriptional regulator|nr:Crp/Fnr family transcriptional regulator [Synergistaceae bacterium]
MKSAYTAYPTRLLYLPGGAERLKKYGEAMSFPKDHVIIEPGILPSCCYLVKRGRVVAYEYTSRGGELLYNFMEEGALLLEANLLTDVPAQVYFKTTEPSELIRIEKEVLLRAMEADSRLMRDIVGSISGKFFSAMDQIRQEGSHNARWKICNLLLIFAERHGVPYDGKTLIKERLSQQTLANLLGMNRVTTTRIIRELKDLNLIELINGYYCIRDDEKLKLHVEFLSDCGE